MVRVTLAQMRRSIPRLVAAGLAIAIGTAFVAATLLAGGVMDRTGKDAVTAQFAQADVVLDGSVTGGTGGNDTLTEADLDTVRALPGVAAADVLTPLGVQLRTPSQNRWQLMLPVVSDSRLTALVVADGRMPSAAGEVALPERAAQALGVELGDTVAAVWQEPPANDDDAWRERTQDVTVVGLVDDPHHAWTSSGGAGVVTLQDAMTWNRVTSPTDLGGVQVLVAGVPGTSPADLRARVAAALPHVTVMTRDEAADEALDHLGDSGSTALVSVVMGFAAIALLVAALVIANTFQVLVAQRTRTLALLRAVGARRSQLRGSVLLEAAILGLASSAVGVLAGIGLAQGMLAVLSRTNVSVPLPSSVTVTWPVIVVPLLAGTAVTLLSSLVPARAATRVTPIEALRPLDAPDAHRGAGAVRRGWSIALTAVGLVGLGGAVLLGLRDGSLGAAPLGLGVLFGAVSFVGVLLGAVFWVPPVVRLVQRALAGLGPVPRLATANTVRNPRRTAATSTALLIGVTLVVMMSTGAASARASLDRTLDVHFPVDITVTPVDAAGAVASSSASGGVSANDEGSSSESSTLPEGLVEKVAALDGVGHVATLRSALMSVDHRDGNSETLVVRSLSPDEAALVLRDHAAAGLLADDAVLLPDWADAAGPAQVRAVDRDGNPLGDDVEELRVELAAGLDAGLVTPATMNRLAPGAPTDSLFVSLASGADPVEVLREVQDSLDTGSWQVSGPGAERAQYDHVIDVLLAVVVGLLGVAVLIALLGVTNTLSLSVIERRRESATLRAIGLSRRRLRAMLAVEGVLIAGVGAVLGIVFGLLYGWAGAATVLGQAGGVTLAVPWRDLAIVLVVALGAGLLASVVPARSAVRTPPVAALAEE
jgi:putative ABC transport system permease protein